MVRLMGIFQLFRSIAGRPQRGRSSEGPGNGRSAGITCASATSSSPATSSGSCERGDNVQMIQVALKVSCGEWTNRSNDSSHELADRDRFFVKRSGQPNEPVSTETCSFD